MDEVTRIWASREIGCIVSLGTGIPADGDIGKNLTPLFHTLKSMSLDTEKTAREFKHEMGSRYPEKKLYFRFNPNGLADIGLEEWKELGRVNVATRDYMIDQREELLLCAKQMCYHDGV